MDHSCECCGASFKKKSNLITHKKSAKYCLAIRGEGSVTCVCSGCGKSFNYMASLARHKKVCTSIGITLQEKDDIIDNLNVEIEKLHEELEEKDVTIATTNESLAQAKNKIKTLKKEVYDIKLILENSKGQLVQATKKEKPVVNNNNTYVNKLLNVKCDTIRPFTIETVREDVTAGKYTFDLFIQGEKGIVEFISAIISQSDQKSYVCTDSSRQRFHRLMESREWKDDNGATFLNKVLDELKDPATDYYNRVHDMMCNGDKDTGDFLLTKTKPIAIGITCPRSKERVSTFTKIRNEVKMLATI